MADAGQAGNGMTGLERAAGAGSALARASAMASNLRGRVMALAPGQRRWLGASALMVAAVCAGVFWWAGRTDWRVLFSGMDGKDLQQIEQELAAAGIPYELTEDGGGIRVGADQMDKARMEVAAKGMPQTGRMGFELFDKPNWVGSEFDEKVNYQRALEGELEHTIGTLSAVRSARVHLVLPKDSLFTTEQQEAKGSVVLKLRTAAMPQEQVESIRNLVAGAVEHLAPSDVTLVDADGRLNLNAPGKGAAEGDAERMLTEKLVAMLEPLAGRDNVRATVNVSYDESSREQTDEVYDPTQVATLTMQRTEQESGQPAKTSGVPGTANNTPGPAAAGSAQAAAAVPPLMQTGQKDATALPVFPQSAPQMQTVKEENGSYAVTRHLTHLEQAPGRVRRVSAAVVVNDRELSEGAGKTEHAVWKPRSADEMRRLEELAQAAVGFDAKRGDQVVIENVSFSSNVPEVKPPVMEKLVDEAGSVLHEQPALMRTLSAAAIGLLVVMVVLRPMAKQMMKTLSEPARHLLLPEGSEASQSAGVSEDRKVAGGLGAARFAADPRMAEAQGIYEHLSEQIRKEPSQSTRILQSWITQPVEDRG